MNPLSLVFSQKKDSTEKNNPQKSTYILKIFHRAVKSITVDSSSLNEVINSKIEQQYLPYEGKIIRHILVKEYGFEKTFIDTSKVIKYFARKLINHIHANTREWVIRNNLFIKEKTVLNANLVADNERYLRSLEYIHDVRIMVAKINNEPDSIDLVVITKDFLSITVELNDLNKNRFKAKIGDANIMGSAQKVQFTSLVESSRNPQFGYELFYRNNSISNTFINLTAGYSNMYSNLHDGTPDEHTWHMEIERPLVSQYLHVAGALLVSQSKTLNHYQKPDSLFYQYQYNKFDAWIGYNFGVRKFLYENSVKNRKFISIRYFKNKFNSIPYQLNDKLNFRLNDRKAVLAQFTFFRQKFYKTNYVIGFGTTEDIPYGYNIALTTGWYKQLKMERLYAGVDANKYSITDGGTVIQYFLLSGAFLNKRNIQDATVLFGISSFSRILVMNHLKIRQYLRLSFTKQFNRVGLDPLSINNVFGIQYISSDSATGNQRSSLHTETIFFLKYKLLGFKFAPFASADLSYFTPVQKNISNSGFYLGLGGGLRTRNENILFKTIEMRFMYFPRKSTQHNAFKFSIITNLRFRYNNNYVKAPEIIMVNSDFTNNIY
jgi:hypothetical protein